MKPTSLLRAVCSLVVTVFEWLDENDFVTLDRLDYPLCAAGVPDANRALSMRCAEHSFKRTIRLMRKHDIDPESKRTLQRLCKRMKELHCRIVAFSGIVFPSKQIMTFVEVIRDKVVTLECLYRIRPAELHGITGLSTTGCCCELELKNMLVGLRTGMHHGQDDETHEEWTRRHFDVRGSLTSTDSQEIFNRSRFHVPNLRNASGHDCSLIVASRFLACLGRPFLDMVEASHADALRTKNVDVNKGKALEALIALLDNAGQYAEAKDTTALRQHLFKDKPANNDLDVIVVMLRLLNCLTRQNVDRFKSYVDRVRVCPLCGKLNYVPTLSQVAIYVWAKRDFDYNERHDVYQYGLAKDFDQAENRFANSFRTMGDARRDTMRYCSSAHCNLNKVKYPDGLECRVRERLTTAKPSALPRWQIIQTKVDVVNPDVPNDHEDNRPNFEKLSVKPHATLQLHNYFQKSVANPQGRPDWITGHNKPYKLRGYALLSNETYQHVVWRTSFEINRKPYYLHCDDKYLYLITEEDYHREDQKILCMVYETDAAPAAAAAAPTPPTRSLTKPPQFVPGPNKRMRFT